MICEPGSLIPNVPIRLNKINLRPNRFTCDDDEYKLPRDYEIKRHDVLCGQLKGPGNERLRIIAEIRVMQYLKASSRKEKVQIIDEVVAAVREAGGNFIRKGPARVIKYPKNDDMNMSFNQWYDVGNLKAREKSSQMLRLCANNILQNQPSAARSLDGLTSQYEDIALDQHKNSNKRPIQSVTSNMGVQPIDNCISLSTIQEDMDSVARTKRMKYNSDTTSLSVDTFFQSSVPKLKSDEYECKSVLPINSLMAQWNTPSLSLEDVMFSHMSSVIASKKMFSSDDDINDVDDISIVLPPELISQESILLSEDCVLLPEWDDYFQS